MNLDEYIDKVIISKSHVFYSDKSKIDKNPKNVNKFLEDSIELFEEKRAEIKDNINASIKELIPEVVACFIDQLKLKYLNEDKTEKVDDLANGNIFTHYSDESYQLSNDDIECISNQLTIKIFSIFQSPSPSLKIT